MTSLVGLQFGVVRSFGNPKNWVRQGEAAELPPAEEACEIFLDQKET